MNIFDCKKAAEKWMLNQVDDNIIQMTAFVVVQDNDVIKVKSSNRAERIAAGNNCYAFSLIYRNGQVETTLI